MLLFYQFIFIINDSVDCCCNEKQTYEESHLMYYITVQKFIFLTIGCVISDRFE